MDCNYFVGKDWRIGGTTGLVVQPFVAPNPVAISVDDDSFTVTVTDLSADPPEDQSWGGFKCQNNTLSGSVEASTGTFQLLILPQPGTDRNKIHGQWDPGTETEGTWTGNEGGSGGSDEDTGRH